MGGGSIIGCAVVVLHISTSGGITGVGAGRDARIDVDALPHVLQAETCEVMTPETLGAMAAKPAPPGADRMSYTIELEAVDGTVEHYVIGDGNMPPEMLDLIDTLMAQEN